MGSFGLRCFCIKVGIINNMNKPKTLVPTLDVMKIVKYIVVQRSPEYIVCKGISSLAKQYDCQQVIGCH